MSHELREVYSITILMTRVGDHIVLSLKNGLQGYSFVHNFLSMVLLFDFCLVHKPKGRSVLREEDMLAFLPPEPFVDEQLSPS